MQQRIDTLPSARQDSDDDSAANSSSSEPEAEQGEQAEQVQKGRPKAKPKPKSRANIVKEKNAAIKSARQELREKNAEIKKTQLELKKERDARRADREKFRKWRFRISLAVPWGTFGELDLIMYLEPLRKRCRNQAAALRSSRAPLITTCVLATCTRQRLCINGGEGREFKTLDVCCLRCRPTHSTQLNTTAPECIRIEHSMSSLL
jgi:hypothetical protein